MNVSAPRLVRSMFRRLSAAGCATAMVFMATAVPPVPSAAEVDRGFTAIGKLSRMPADAVAAFGNGIAESPISGTIVVLPEVRQIWQFFLHRAPSGTGLHTAIAVRNLDTLKMIKTIRVDKQLRRGTANQGGDWMHTIDRAGKRLFLVANGDDPIIEYDLRTFAEKRHTLSVAALPQGLGAIEYDRFDDDLVLLFGLPPNGGPLNTKTIVYRFDLASGDAAGPRDLRSCTGPLPSTDLDGDIAQIPVHLTQEYAYVPCTRAGNVAAIVRIKRNELTVQTSVEQMAVGPVAVGTVLADERSGRLFLMTLAGEIFAFDTATMSFVGTVSAHSGVGLSRRLTYGIDQDSGRVFFMSPTFGLGVVEGRYFPVPQARAERGLRDNAQQRIYSDARTNRLFVLPDVTGFNPQPAYTIYRVDAAPIPPDAPDPDASTVDLPEKPGVTESQYTASASGYGVRALLANGVNAMTPLPSAFGGNPGALVLAKHLSSKCGFTDREMFAARVAKTEVDSGSAAVEASAIEIDNTTKLDLDQPSRCDVNIKNGSGTEVFAGIFSTAPQAAALVDNPNSQDAPRWSYKPAECTSSQGGAPVRSDGDNGENPPLGTNKAECPVPTREARVTGQAKASLPVGALTVGYAHADTEIYADAAGVHVRATAVAGDIDIGGTIRIGEVRSVATSVSNGRPRKGDASTHTVTISEVSVNGQRLCGAVCNPAVIDGLNQLGTGRFELRTGGSGCVDEKLRKGSPRGALAGVQKAAERQASDQALIGDFTSECPGLEMLWYNDNAQWGRARQLYQFAGVSTSASYAIFLLPTGFPLPDVELPDEVPVPTVETPAPVVRPAPELVAGQTSGGGSAAPNIIEAIGRGLRLIWTNPREALVLFTAWLLFAQPVLLERRRRRLRQVWAQ